ncbi:helix-turn-helix transcriptional regulator [Curtobacterium sp. VKM Ac-1393]|uniref:helix-turn-helix transcriptional regulator n=1 Tax=Curtobacterium sp. VKM Ac-1393 TaxID=2783814 RepID=UPI00188D4D31|nr:AraC family transcriptional regulator [Curtobacterium sp. VKM Ac-1393]MBF4606763.1 helix-turn-helix transcriptional regulator [Curtobacterium sp. VKM Ac-1393]
MSIVPLQSVEETSSANTTEPVAPASTAPVRLEASATTPEQALERIPGLVSGTDWQTRSTTGAYSFRYLAVGDGNVTLRRSQMRGYVRGTTAPDDSYVVVLVLGGVVSLDLLRGAGPVAPGTPALVPTERRSVVEARNHDAVMVHLDRGFVRTVAEERHGLPAGGLHLDERTVPTVEAVTRWRQVLESARRVLAEHGVATPAWSDATRAVAVAFLALYPPRAAEPSSALWAPRNARIRRAVDHVHDHAAEPIAVSDLASVSGLSVRAVQESFQRLFGMPPSAYVRSVRLQRVRGDLLRLDTASSSVSEVARRWGFAHLGRFSAEYTTRYGEYPKTTLHR